MSTWMPIETAPKDGTIVRLRDARGIYNCVMAWNKKRKLWIGMAIGIFGSSKTYWDENFCKIAEWRNVD